MGREAATYLLALTPHDARAVVKGLEAAGIQRGRKGEERVDYCLRDPHRYWIDLRVHRAAAPHLEIRIALTNDTWSIRAPLERALTPFLARIAGEPIRDGDGETIAIAGSEGWSLALEDDYGRRRDAFVRRCGEYSAPLSADHVYMYLHQTRWNEDNDNELAWHREREIAMMEEMWERGEDAAGGA